METKVPISVNDCQPGMKTAETVFNDYGAVIVSENSILDEHMIRKLQTFRISKILIFKMTDEKIEENKNKFKVHYDTQVETVKGIIKDIGMGRNLRTERVNSIVGALVENKKENRDIVYCINEVRDTHEYTYAHCINVSLLSMMIGKWLNYDDQTVRDLATCGLLHDIGKSKINLAILNKPDKLTPEEFEEIKKHVLYGYRILQTMPDINNDIAVGVLMHHEREDGSGYLLGAKGPQIHQYAKVLAVADVFDAMTSNRVYREKQSPFEVFEHIQNGTFGKFDPKITLAFLNRIAGYYVGDRCKLSTGDIAEIIQINPNTIAKPLVKVEDNYIDLSKQSDIKMTELIME